MVLRQTSLYGTSLARQPIFNSPASRHCAIRNTVYATYPPRHGDTQGFVEEGLELKSQGFTAYKIHSRSDVHLRHAGDGDRSPQAVGDDMTLILDPNNGYDLRKALEIGLSLTTTGSTGSKTQCCGTTSGGCS